MLKLEINGQDLVPVRLAPFLMGWEFSPDTLARILAHREGFYRVVPLSYHFQPDKSFRQITSKEWDTCLEELEILTNELKAGGQIEVKNSPEWRIKSIQVLPVAAFFWLDELENTWSNVLSKERIALPREREGDRGLNLSPEIPRDVLKFIYEGFESLLIHQQMHDNGYLTDIIHFTALHHYLILDPYYGTESAASASIVGSIYRDNNRNQLFQQFGIQFSRTPCESDQQRHLIYLWCGLMGLPVYRDSQPLEWQGEDFLNHWTEDFVLRLDEIRDFLRNNEWPLPTIFFPNEPNDTERKVRIGGEEFKAASHEFGVILPQLEKDLAELEAIQPESIEARRHKKVEIEQIKGQIATIKREPQKGPANQPLPSEGKNHFVLEGDYWNIAYQGGTSILRNTKGLRYIAWLIQNRGKEIGIADLYYAINPPDTGSTKSAISALTSGYLEESNLSIDDPGSSIPGIDEQYIREIRQKSLEINDDIEIAKDTGNLTRVSELKAEMAELVNYQSKNLGLKGKPRSFSNTLKRINDSVKKCIRTDLKKIDTHLPLLGNHLRNVALGPRLCYCPDQPVDWIITF